MSDTPRLSICVPSRNRQNCFRQTIRDLIASPRPDLQFVFVDNSDDPSVMDAFMAGIDDPRVAYLPSADRTLSMMDNWERTAARATGDWVTMIGDDDYVDPDVIDLIAGIEARMPEIDAVAWNRGTFEWASAREDTRTVTLSLANRIVPSPHDAIMDRLFGWLGASHVPQCPFGIYHGAVHRRAIERIRTQFSGRLFEHPVVDFDFSHKLVASGRKFAYIDRPMSILGVCAESNSAAVGKAKEFDAARENYLKENGNVFEVATVEAGFPFTQNTGVAGSIMQAQHWFRRKYGFEFPNWEGNFIRAVTNECAMWEDPADFERNVGICRNAFSAWEGGKYLRYFTPTYSEPKGNLFYHGVNKTNVVINQEIAEVETPAEFYAVTQQILPAFADIEIKL